MDEANELKRYADNSETVNFENLHANMALEPENNSETRQQTTQEDLDDKQTSVENRETISDENADLSNVEESATQQLDSSVKTMQETGEDPDVSAQMINDEQKDDVVASIAQEIIKSAVDNATEQITSEKRKVSIAQGIIKSAVDNATEQISSEKSKNNTDEVKTEKKEEWLDILGNGLLRKKVLKSGDGVDTRPKREEEATIKYEIKLEDGSIVESSDSHALVLGFQDVIDAIDLSVALMELGEKATVESDSRYGYGADGKPPNIPANAKLFIEIELLKVQDGPFSATIDLERRITWADSKRQKGNMYYSEKNYAQATMIYTRCTKAMEKGWMCEKSHEGRSRINELRIKCYNNLTASQMKEEKWRDALKSCRAAEKLEPNNVKALFRKGKIHVMLGELEKGVEALTRAGNLEPDNKTIATEISKHKRKLEKQKESQKAMYKRMLGTSNSDSVDDHKTSSAEQTWFRNWGPIIGGSLAAGVVLIGLYLAQRN